MNVVRIGLERLDAFVDLAYAIGASDPRFVPPLRMQVLAEITGHSEFAKYGTVELFGVERDGALVARAAAIVNPRLIDASGAVLGQVGYFESRDDDEAARALFTACFEALRAKGARQIVGPMNGGAHRAHRLMTAGFDREPFLFEPRNPRHYPRLFEAAGFARVHAWRTYELTTDQMRRFGRVLARASRAFPQTAVLDPIHPRSPDLLPRLHALLDRVWQGHVGYAPISVEELGEVIGGAFAVMTARNVCLVHDGRGTDLGVSFMLPNWVSELREIGGDATRWASWLDRPRPKELIMHTHAVVAEARRTNAVSIGPEAGLAQLVTDGYEKLIISLVTEDWAFFDRQAEPTRKYALYGRAL